MFAKKLIERFDFLVGGTFWVILAFGVIQTVGLTDARAQPSDEWFEKQCTRLVTRMNLLENECVNECNLQRKNRLINQMISIQSKIDLLIGDCPVENYNALCGGILNPENIPLSVTPASLALYIEESETLTATLDGNCLDGGVPGVLTGKIGWLSADPGIAEVSQAGIVTGKSVGVTSVFAISLDIPQIISNSVPVQVDCFFDATAHVDITPAAPSILVGDSFQLYGSIVGPECLQSCGDLVWRSDNPAVASVGPAGLVRGESPGSTYITVEVGTTGVTGSTAVMVECDSTDASVDVTPASAKIAVGETVQLSATVNGPDCMSTDITWSSSDPSVASVSPSGLVSGQAEGYATIFADVAGTPAGWWGSSVTVISSWCDENNDGMLDLEEDDLSFGCCGYEILSSDGRCTPDPLPPEAQAWGYTYCPVGRPCSAGGGCGTSDEFFMASCCGETGECRECIVYGDYIPGIDGSCPQFYTW